MSHQVNSIWSAYTYLQYCRKGKVVLSGSDDISNDIIETKTTTDSKPPTTADYNGIHEDFTEKTLIYVSNDNEIVITETNKSEIHIIDLPISNLTITVTHASSEDNNVTKSIPAEHSNNINITIDDRLKNCADKNATDENEIDSNNVIDSDEIIPCETPEKVDNGTALILTPFIEKGQIKEARKACKVNPEVFLGYDSYSGFLTVNKTYNSNTFFWYFPVQHKKVNETPWIIWLQGGPGVSSLIGLFDEIGPFKFNNFGDLKGKNIRVRDFSRYSYAFALVSG